MLITISTDGSGWRQGTPGGCAAILRAGHHYREVVDGLDATTANEMELRAILLGLSYVRVRAVAILIRSDSQNAIGWASGRYNRDRHLYAAELGSAIDGLITLHAWRVEYVHIRGHTGDPDNERADQLAGMERKRRINALQARSHAADAVCTPVDGVLNQSYTVESVPRTPPDGPRRTQDRKQA